MSTLRARHMDLLAAGGLQATGTDNNSLAVLLDANPGLALGAGGLANTTVIGSTGAGMSLVNGALAKSADGTTHQLRSITSAGGSVAITQPNDNELNLELVVNFGRGRGIYDASGNTFPTAATSPLFTNDAIEAMDYYIIGTAGTLGGVDVNPADLVFANIDNATAAADFTIVDGQSVSQFVNQTRQLTPGNGIQIDGANVAVDLSADRTFTVQNADDSIAVAAGGVSVAVSDGLTLSAGNGVQVLPLAAAAGTLKPVTVSAAGVSIDEATLDHDALLNFAANEHIDHSTVDIATAATTSGLTGGGDITATRNLAVDITGTTAITGAVDDADEVLLHDTSAGGLRKVTRAELVGSAGRSFENLSLAGGVASVTLAAAPAANEVQVWVPGGSALTPGTDFTVAGTTVNLSAAQQARLVTSDSLQVLYLPA